MAYKINKKSTKRFERGSGQNADQAAVKRKSKNPLREYLIPLSEQATQNNLPRYLIFLLGCLLYINTIPFDYTLDDKIVITHNEFTKQGFSGIPDIMAYDLFVGFYGKKKDLVAGGRYRPLSVVSYAIEWQLFGRYPQISHFINMLLNAFSGVLLYIILIRLFKVHGDKWYLSLPFVITVLFVAHPLHTEVVANIKGRDEILTLLFALGTLYYTLNYLEDKQTKSGVIAGVLFFLAYLSKESALIFLAIIPFFVYYLTNKKFEQVVISVLPIFITTVVYVTFRFWLLGKPSTGSHGGLMNDPFTGALVTDKFATIFYTLGLYLKLIFIPHPLTHDYYPFHIPIIKWADPRAFVSLLAYAGLIIVAVIGIIKKNIYSFAILIFLAGLSLASNIVFPIGTFMNERFMHVSLLGACIVIAFVVLWELPKKIKNPEILNMLQIGVLALIIVGYSAKTIDRNYAWESDYSLFITDVETSSGSAKVNMSAGASYIDVARETDIEEEKKTAIDKAIFYLDKSIKIYPTYSNSWLLLGNALYEIKNYSEAVKRYDYAASIHHNYVDAMQNLMHIGVLCTDNGQYEVALDSYKALLKYTDNEADVYNRIGRIYGQKMNNIDMALAFFQQGINKDPNNTSLLDNMGVAYGIKGMNEEAIQVFERILQLKPNNVKVLNNLTAVYFHLGDTEKHNYYKNLAAQFAAQQAAGAPQGQQVE
ncbi:MAG: DUF1736 domain-containing protein [Flavobacteriales bacterium]|nr:DUF1736 domain-containing protein [Flavobacteriales bacterium]